MLTLAVPRGFRLARVVCSYGFFVLAPNRWDPAAQVFSRPLRLGGAGVVHITVAQPTTPAGPRRTPEAPARLTIACDRRLSRAQAGLVRARVARMLRVDEDLTAWHRLCPAAARRGFGRLIRSPDLFEDVVKTITLCNVTWPNTVRMNRLLCERIGGGAFPTPRQIAGLSPARLKDRAGVGYRADRIVRLARDIVDGRLDPAWFEAPQRTSHELYHALLKLHGIGPYAASNLCQLLGHYDRIAIDTETYRHYCAQRGIDRPGDPKTLHRAIEDHYARFAPYPFLAYWFDIWRFYERFIGKPAWRWAGAQGHGFTAAAFRRRDTATDEHGPTGIKTETQTKISPRRGANDLTI